MERIKVTNINRHNGYIELHYTIILDIPTNLSNVNNINSILLSYKSNYSIYQDVSDISYISLSSIASYSADTTLNYLKDDLYRKYTDEQSFLDNLVLTDYDEIMSVYYDGVEWK